MHVIIYVHAHRSQKHTSYSGANMMGVGNLALVNSIGPAINFYEYKSMTGSRDPCDPAWMRPCPAVENGNSSDLTFHLI